MAQMASAASSPTVLDAQDLQRKLHTAEALRSYDKCCADTHLLDAAESERQLRARIAYLEPQCEILQLRYAESERAIEELERLATGASVKSEEHIAQTKSLRREISELEKRSKASEDQLHQSNRDKESSSSEIAMQRDVAQAALAEEEARTRAANERCVALEGALEAVRAAKAETEKEIKGLRAAFKGRSDAELKSLQEKLDNALQKITELEAESAQSLEKTNEAADAAQAQKSVGKKLQEQVVDLEAQVAALTARNREHEKAHKGSEKKVKALEAKLAAEGTWEEKARTLEAKLAAEEAWEEKVHTLEAKLEQTQKRLKAAQTTKVPVDNPRKRPTTDVLTMEDLEKSAKKPRQKTPPKESAFSLTPYLKKQAQVITGSPDASRTGDVTGQNDDAGDKSMMVPAVVESNQPTRLLLAGANRRAKKRAPQETVPEMPEPEADAPAVDNNDEEDVGEDSMLLMAAPPVAKATKAKAKPKATKEKAAKEKEPKKAVAAAAAPKTRGIRPTVFDDDDGTGRLEVVLDADSQEPRGRRVAAPKLAQPGGPSVFAKEISPPKKRPEGLKRFTVGKKPVGGKK